MPRLEEQTYLILADLAFDSLVEHFHLLVLALLVQLALHPLPKAMVMDVLDTACALAEV